MKNQTVLVIGPKILKDKLYNRKIIYFLDDKSFKIHIKFINQTLKSI